MKDGHRTTIDELCILSSGHGFTPRDWAKKGLPIIRIQNLNGSKDFNYFGGSPEPDWIVDPGDLLFAWAGVPGVSFGPTIWKGRRGLLNQHIFRVTPRPGVNKDWLYVALKVITARIERKAHGFKSSLLHVRKTEITNQRVLLPALEDQQKIARIMALWSKAIDLAEHVVAEKQDSRKWLMQQLLTGTRRLSGFGAAAKQARLPNNWKEDRIDYLFKPVNRKNSKGLTKVLTASGEHGLVEQKEYFNHSVAGESLDSYLHICRGEFAYNRSSMNGYPYGAIKRLDNHGEGVLSTLYICFELISDKCFSDYYKHLFERRYLDSQLRKIAQVGARAHGLLNVTLHDFFSMKVPCPPIEEQRRIAGIIDIADRELALLRAQLDALREQKKGLMQKLLTGEVRAGVSRR
ncbi:MAG: restriction endonuclease subunit S [Syntrophorhabdales bacterium]|jgi:type I restriction enzyme S subunit